MPPRRIVAALTAVVVGAVVLPAPPAAAEIASPGAITMLTASPGPRPGEIVIRWQATGLDTDYFQLETAITSFSATDPTMPRRGRAARTLTVASTARSITLTGADTAASGAGLGTANHLYYLLTAVNHEPAGLELSPYPRVQAVMPRGLPAKRKGTPVRAATFNVRTAKATTDKRSWLTRAPAVAAEIVRSRPGVVALQELSPAGADGKKRKKGALRQTTSLLAALEKAGGARYRLVRTTSYVKAGTPHGSQGARILYDSSRYRLLTRCAETTRTKSYNSSCTLSMPLLAGDSEKLRRRAAYAEFKDRRTKRRFFVVSAHLDQRHSPVLATEIAYNRLRGQQAATVADKINKINKARRKVILGADLNSWQTNKVGHAPHSALVAKGYFDSASASRVTNIAYGTSNQFAPVLRPNPYGFGTRIDAVMVKGTRGANRFVNVMAVSNTERPSDHNLLLADLVL